MAIYSIYRLTNIVNGKVYIGKTTQQPETRFRQHIKDARRGSTYPLHNAIRKYGERSFQFDVILTVLDEQHLNHYEVLLIEQYQSHILNGQNLGYNMTKGGDGFDSVTAKHIQHKRVANGTHPFQGKVGAEASRAIQLRLIAEGKHHMQGERGTAIATKISQDRVASGTHHFQGEQGSKNASEYNRRRVANGTHIFAGEAGSELSKRTSAIQLASGTHVSQKFRTCPHCNKSGKGGTMLRWHFDNCKSK